MTRLIVWRHGRTAWNATGRVQGQTDVDLDETGHAQAAASAPRLASLNPDVIVSSDLRRASRTADALSTLVGLTVDLDPRLRERHFGPWQGLTGAEIKERYPEDYERWRNESLAGAAIADPAVETVDDLTKRVSAAFRDAAQRVGDGTAVLVTHGGAARVGCGTLLGWPPTVWRTLGALANCHLAELVHTSRRGWQLLAHNVP